MNEKIYKIAKIAKIQLKYYKDCNVVFFIIALITTMLLVGFLLIDYNKIITITITILSLIGWIYGVVKNIQIIIFYEKNKEAINTKW